MFRNSDFFIFMILFNICYSQSFEYIGNINEDKLDYSNENYDNVPINFVVQDSIVITSNEYQILLFDYTKEISSNNPLFLLFYNEGEFKVSDDILVNKSLSVLNLRTKQIYDFFDVSVGYRSSDSFKYFVKDSLIYIFQQGKKYFYDYYDFKIYSLRTKSYKKVYLSTLLDTFKSKIRLRP